MAEDKSSSRSGTDFGKLMGPIWLMGWLFTIGWLDLSFWRSVFAIIIWPYFIGAALR